MLHVRRGDRVLGLFPPDKIKQMIADGKITQDDLIRVEGDEQWIAIHDVPNLVKIFESNFPSTAERKKNAGTDSATSKPQKMFIKRGDEVKGPLTLKAVQDGISAGKIERSDQIGPRNTGPWKEAGSLARLFPSDEVVRDEFEGFDADAVEILDDWDQLAEDEQAGDTYRFRPRQTGKPSQGSFATTPNDSAPRISCRVDGNRLETNLPIEKTFEIVVQAFHECGVSEVGQNPSRGVITGSTGFDMKSWGQKTTANISSYSGTTVVEVTSRAKAQLVDWGRGKQEAETIIEVIADLIPSSSSSASNSAYATSGLGRGSRRSTPQMSRSSYKNPLFIFLFLTAVLFVIFLATFGRIWYVANDLHLSKDESRLEQLAKTREFWTNSERREFLELYDKLHPQQRDDSHTTDVSIDAETLAGPPVSVSSSPSDSSAGSSGGPVPPGLQGRRHRRRVLDLFSKGLQDKAIAEMTEAIRLDPNDANAYFYRAAAYSKKGEHDKVIADFTEAIRLDPNDAWAYINRGLAHHHNREYDKAIADYTEAIRLDPNNAWAYYNRGTIYRRVDEDDRADSDIATAKRLGLSP